MNAATQIPDSITSRPLSALTEARIAVYRKPNSPEAWARYRGLFPLVPRAPERGRISSVWLAFAFFKGGRLLGLFRSLLT